MRMAIWPAILAVAPVICFGMELAQKAAPDAAKEQTQSAQSQAAPAAEGGDPSKLAMPASAQGTLANDRSFVIGPEDQLSIGVWGDSRIGGPVLVRPDGRISINLLGEVQAAGRTPAELGNDITELLKQKEILKRPQVIVAILKIESKKYSINGEVLKPGSFPLVVPTRVMEALVNAGGFKDFANKKDILIIRGNQRLKFNWNEVVKGKKIEQNTFLEPGDIIIVK